jgi:hypothetical protein
MKRAGNSRWKPWACFLLAFGPLLRGQMTDVLTYHNDNSRTGQAPHEEVLTPANVVTNHFGLLRTLAVDGNVDAEPLYAAGVVIPGAGQHNVLIVATEHDSVYAFNADGTNLYWKVSMLASGEEPSDPRSCDQVTPEIGITATPVIDRQAGSNGTTFVVAMSKKGTTYFQRVHALDLATGADLVTPVDVAATYPGTGDGWNGAGSVVFAPEQYKERCGLLLLNGVLYTAWASHCDNRPYTGWVIGYDEQTLNQTSILNITPNGNEGAFWGAGAGMAADGEGNIYALAGNGTFDTNLVNGFPSNGDFGNSFLKFSTAGNTLAVADYFCMSNAVAENGMDEDLGSGGALLLPDMMDAGNNLRQLAVGAGKDSILYIVERNMGHFDADTNAIWQQADGAVSGGLWSMGAYWNGFLYYGGVGDYVKAFPFQDALLGAMSSETPETFGYPGATPGVSANGTNAGIVWATENTSPAILHAFNATNLANELYNSSQAGSRDQFGAGNKFITPMIASARVYVGTTSGVGVFGLFDDSTLTPLQGWRDTNFGNPSNVGAGANGASPAGDGIPNLIKYALGLNPLAVASPNQLPSGGLQPDGGIIYLTLTVSRAAIVPDVHYVVEVSGDLINWQSGAPATVTLTNSPTQLVVRDTVAFGAAAERFIRLVVTNP